MKIRRQLKWELVPLLYILFCGTFLYGATSAEVVIPWGGTRGTLKEAIFTDDSRQEWRGPSSFRIDKDGSIYILNTLGSTVEKFSPSGTYVSTYSFPPFTEHDEETVGLDLTITSQGEVCVLEESERKLIIFNPSGTIKKTINIPDLPSSIVLLSYLDCDSQGNYYIFNAYDNVIHVIDSVGSLIASHKSLSGANYVVAADGSLISVVEKNNDPVDGNKHPDGNQSNVEDKTNKGNKLSKPVKVTEYEVISAMPLTGITEVTGTYKYKPSTASVAPVGVLSNGAIYVEMVNGIVEKVEAHKILVLDSKGIMKNIFTISRPSAVLQMIRSRAVTPDGKIACTRVTKKGLVIRSYPRN